MRLGDHHRIDPADKQVADLAKDLVSLNDPALFLPWICMILADRLFAYDASAVLFFNRTAQAYSALTVKNETLVDVMHEHWQAVSKIARQYPEAVAAYVCEGRTVLVFADGATQRVATRA